MADAPIGPGLPSFSVPPAGTATPAQRAPSVADNREAVCACGATRHATNEAMCSAGHFIKGNAARRTHGAYAFRDRGDRAVGEDLRTSADELLAGIIADKGGIENMSALTREYAKQARDLRVILDVLARWLVQNGVTTTKGRTRSAVGKYLEVFDRFDKCAQRLGLARDARPAVSLHDYLTSAPRSGGDQP